jgi:hypothetical protein
VVTIAPVYRPNTLATGGGGDWQQQCVTDIDLMAGLALKWQGSLSWESAVPLSADGWEGRQLWSVQGDNETGRQSTCKSFTFSWLTWKGSQVCRVEQNVGCMALFVIACTVMRFVHRYFNLFTSLWLIHRLCLDLAFTPSLPLHLDPAFSVRTYRRCFPPLLILQNIRGSRFFTGDFGSWTVHFVNIRVKTQQMQPLFMHKMD